MRPWADAGTAWCVADPDVTAALMACTDLGVLRSSAGGFGQVVVPSHLGPGRVAEPSSGSSITAWSRV